MALHLLDVLLEQGDHLLAALDGLVVALLAHIHLLQVLGRGGIGGSGGTGGGGLLGDNAGDLLDVLGGQVGGQGLLDVLGGAVGGILSGGGGGGGVLDGRGVLRVGLGNGRGQRRGGQGGEGESSEPHCSGCVKGLMIINESNPTSW